MFGFPTGLRATPGAAALSLVGKPDISTKDLSGMTDVF